MFEQLFLPAKFILSVNGQKRVPLPARPATCLKASYVRIPNYQRLSVRSRWPTALEKSYRISQPNSSVFLLLGMTSGEREALDGQEVGFKGLVELSVDEAFGPRDEALLQSIPKSQFPPGVKVGGQIEGRDEQGHSRAFTVLKIKGDQVMLDGNHPLAGQALRFSVQVLEVRAASEEEVAHGHAHGAHGHHH